MSMRRIIYGILKLLGWRIVGDLPKEIKKAVLIIAPHTSNWDLIYGMSTIYIKNIPARFAIKKEVMFFPLGIILKWIGAIPINRKQQGNLNKNKSQVNMLIETLQKHDKLALIIAP